ncbi:MAG TPA: class I SAM-dependent methyltransferase [Lacunisphaera sp.]|jgi:2-polyprenyl-3-methyl-5-hydroxy-6-metoxy-1,4-benzoquinol methylase|nr:class I SAM-dependent methyltransferase [Lacunisphaera sp.]
MPDRAFRAVRRCWCGEPNLFAYSDDYNVCRVCGTLVTRAEVRPADLAVTADQDELYSKDYWLRRQPARHGLPSLEERTRTDLPERCVHWLKLLLARRLPPARVLEVGCAHGGYVAMMRWAGYDAAGIEMSPFIVNYARETFGVPVTAGPVETQDFAAGSFDVIILNDVIEHLPDPAATLGHCARLLKPDGFFIIQTPEYKEHLSYADVIATGDPFKIHMQGKNDEHLYLFSRRSTQRLFAQLGFPHIGFENPIFAYDLFYTASRAPLPAHDGAAVAGALCAQPPAGRLVLALLDKAFESTDRWWEIQRLKAKLSS